MHAPVAAAWEEKQEGEEEEDKEEDAADERGARVLLSGLRPQQVNILMSWAGRKREFDPSVGGPRGTSSTTRTLSIH